MLCEAGNSFNCIIFQGFLHFWGVVILIATIAIAIFKHERREEESKELHGVVATYKLIWNILQKRSVQIVALLQLTIYSCFSAYDAVGYFKFLDTGVSNEKMIPLSSVAGMCVRLLVPFFIVKYTSKLKSLDVLPKVAQFRSMLCLTGALIVWVTPKLIPADGIAPNYVYLMFLMNDAPVLFCESSMRTASYAFFLAKSDPLVAGTYVTLLNTFDNLGGMWPVPTALWLVEKITWRDCSLGTPSIHLNQTNVRTSLLENIN